MVRMICKSVVFFFFFNDTATTEIYTLSLHDALPISLTLKEMTGAAQVEALALGRIDVGLVRPLPEPFAGLASCVMREDLALALPHEHPLAARRRPALRDLEGEPFIMYSPDGPYKIGRAHV